MATYQTYVWVKVDAMALTFEDEKLMHGPGIFEREADPWQ